MTSDKNLDGRFKVQGPLRCSGVGSLMCASDQDGARTAIRVVPQHAQGGAAVAAVLKFPVHPVLPRALGSGQLNDSAWVALDFPEGTLVSQAWPLDLPRLLAMGSAVASALSALHQARIVHGELSGESVLVVPTKGSSDRFVLFDAPLVVMNRMTDRRGEERLLAQLTHIVPFLSPERARGLEADESSDIWALGVLLSLAAGAKTVPGSAALEKIAAIVTGKWRPAVPGTLPISLRLLLTRMLAPEPASRPSALDVAMELATLLEAIPVQEPILVHPSATADTNPVGQARVAQLVEKMNEPDPFAALVEQGVTVNSPDANAEPTRRVIADFTDPDAPLVFSAPEPEAIVVPKEVAVPAITRPTLQPEAAVAPTASPVRRRTPQPLPPILDPQAITVAPSPRMISPSPMPKQIPNAGPVPSAPPAELSPMLTTMRFGELPSSGPAVTAPVPASEPSMPLVEAVAVSAPALALAPAPAMIAEAPAKSIHDELEDQFNESLRKASKRRLMYAAVAAAGIVLGATGLILKSVLSSDDADAPRAEKIVKADDEETAPLPAKAKPAVAKPASKPAVAVKPAPAPAPAPVAEAKPAPAPAPAPAPVAEAKPAPKPAPAPVAEAKPAPKPVEQAKAAPAEPRHEVRKAPAATRTPAPASHKSASRLDEGD
jgi:serine/threonine protein kinase